MAKAPLLVLSPNTNIEWHEGEVLVGLSSGRQVKVEAPLLPLLQAFGFPTSVDVVLRQFVEHRSEMSELIGHLKDVGVLRELPTVQKMADEASFLVYDDKGMTLANCAKEELSPGCQACKNGTWCCVFPGWDCNAACDFCPQPSMADASEPQDLWCDRLLAELELSGHRLTGLSLSGGEFLLYKDASARIARFARHRFPDIHLWGYTNGILANRETLVEVQAWGLNELRFDLAATGFAGPIIEHVEVAVDLFDWVVVEVPALESTVTHLVDRSMLSLLADIGVKQINLVEMLLAPGTPSATNYGDSPTYEVCVAPNTVTLALSESRGHTRDIMEYAHDHDVDMLINDCSAEAKYLQHRQREMKGLARLQLMAQRR
ncbi:MAG: radical SAM protein [Proteobacteria bacterium]|nr:radical SAM protein [Pseudomonadota bacterium]